MRSRTIIQEHECQALRDRYPGLPEDYLLYLQEVGWGETESSRMIYSGPVSPESVYGANIGHSGVLLLGDDLQGYCLGYHIESQRYGEVGPGGEWHPWPKEKDLSAYV